MKRQIKFRAVFFNYENKFLDFQYWGIDVPNKSCNTFPGRYNKGYIKEHNQFTGLKDKNGKEIYEGDIVLAELTGFIKYNMKSIIDFENGCFGIRAIEDEILVDSKDKFKSFDSCNTEIRIEIIGNIYQDKELINN